MIEVATPHIDGQAITAIKATPGGGYRVTHAGGVIHCPPGTRFAASIQAAIDAGIAVEPEKTAAERKAELQSYLAQKHATVEQSTFTHGTAKFRSNPIAVARLSVEAAAAGRAVRGNAAFSTIWLDADGNAVTMNAAEVEALQDALRTHGHKANQTYLDLKAKIEANPPMITLESEIDAAGWPA